MNVLKNHTSEQTAFVVDDYPYGFRLRCKIRYWIETTKRGDRFCSQTTNPKRTGEVWNKPKKSTYSDLMFMYLNDEGHCKCSGISIEWSDLAKVENFLERGQFDLNDKRIKQFHHTMKVVEEARKHIKIEIAQGPTLDLFGTSKETWDRLSKESDEREKKNSEAARKAFAYASHIVAKQDRGE
jgi:hypothetical protein